MGKKTNTEEIFTFLENAKNLISLGRYQFITRRKNLQALAQNGLTIESAMDEILDLVVADYYKGPKQDFDKNRPGEIWEFKKKINGIPFYIKMKIDQENGKILCKCLGFHEDEYA